MIKLGVKVGLAVDSSASNDATTAYDILKIATRGSASILGRDDIGQIAEGKCADMFMIDSSRLELVGTSLDPAAIFGTVGYKCPVDYSLVNGRLVVKKGS